MNKIKNKLPNKVTFIIFAKDENYKGKNTI